MTTENEMPLVVIVDDEREICAALKRCLIRLPAQIETFTSPRQALNLNNSSLLLLYRIRECLISMAIAY